MVRSEQPTGFPYFGLRRRLLTLADMAALGHMSLLDPASCWLLHHGELLSPLWGRRLEHQAGRPTGRPARPPIFNLP
jgi:hypothetical protein